MRNKSWFKFEMKSDIAEIEIFDEIDSAWGVGPGDFKAKLDGVKDAKSIKLLLNSPGGSVFDGMAIHNMLSNYRDRLEIEVVGVAASIASIIAMAGKKLTIASGAYLMIHNPLTIMVGEAQDLRKTADLLDKMKGDFISIYKKKGGKDDKEISDMMDAETWMTADEAIENGFADAVEDYGEIAARLDGEIAKHFAKVPGDLGKNEKKITNPRELENALRDAGCSKREAVAIVADGWKAVGRGDPEPARGDPEKPEIDAAALRLDAELTYETRRLLA